MTDHPKKKIGRKTKLTPELQEKIVQFIRRGLGKEQTAYVCGINPSTLYVWEGKNQVFSEAIKKAEGEFEQNNLAIIQSAAITRLDAQGVAIQKGSWVAAAWLLERKFGDRYAQRLKSEMTGEGGGPVTVKIVRFGDKNAPKPGIQPVVGIVPHGTNGHTNGNGNGNGKH